MSEAERVAAKVGANVEGALARLADYVRYPAISCDPERVDDVRGLAARIASDLSGVGFEGVEILQLPEALPAVIAEKRSKNAAAPTVLIYGHFDLQPVKGEAWTSDPHTIRRAGDRVFARGAADDMGGWVSHLVALEAWLAETGDLPCHVRLFIEGEEEIGSPNLERYMDAFPGAFDSDVMVLTDCENPSTSIPGLTVSLRGLMEVELEVAALRSDVHSGLWGNIIPDPAIGLAVLIARLVDEDGRLKLGRRDVDAAWRERAWSIPLDEETIRKGARLLEGVPKLDDRGRPPAEWVWRQPAMTVLSTTLPTPDREKNAVRAKASAVLSFRVAPGQTDAELFALVQAELLRDPPFSLAVRANQRGKAGMSWLYTPRGPAFEAAHRAYEKAWGQRLLEVGVGGSIPFVALFGRRFSDRPLILNGVMDPETGAHGPDESMHVDVFRKAMLANVYLYDELAKLDRDALRTR